MNKALLFSIVLIACISCSKPTKRKESEYDFLIGKWKTDSIVFTGICSLFETSFSEGQSVDKRFLNKQFIIDLKPDSTFILDNKQENNFSGKYRVHKDTIFLTDVPYPYFIIDSLSIHNLYLKLNYAMIYTVESDSIYIERGPHVIIVMKKE